ncbi:MAG: TOBE domain-containing protein [Steroidobacteraceae bacterium]
MPVTTHDSRLVGRKLALSRCGRRFPASERIDLLEAIGQMGSVSRAAQRLNLTYKAAWDAVDAINNLAEKPVLIRAPGGHLGCGGYLTEHGREFVRLYRLLESGYQRLLTQMQAQVGNFDQLNELLKAITMKTSARNQLRGTVKAIRQGSISAEVVLDIGDGLEIFANIANEAVEDLRLVPGRDAVALIKASFIMISNDENIRTSACNRLVGVVSAVIRGSVNSEVKIQLVGGRTLTAIVTCKALKELDLADGSSCCALVKASHVLIAVNG